MDSGFRRNDDAAGATAIDKKDSRGGATVGRGTRHPGW
jgi:hypothetical protein